jgi:general stress protein 26
MLQVEDECTVEVGRLLTGAAQAIARVRYCWLVTTAETWAVNARPMGWLPRNVDEDDWTLWFITDGRSRKAADIRRGGEATLIFQDVDTAFVTLVGPAMLCEEESELRRRWKKAYDTYFPTEEDRANAALIGVDVRSMKLWIRGVTPEPFGIRPTQIERDERGLWRLRLD